MYRLTSNPIYHTGFQTYMHTCFNLPVTPKGLTFFSAWGSLRFAADSAFLAILAADYSLNATTFRTWGKKQVRTEPLGPGVQATKGWFLPWMARVLS